MSPYAPGERRRRRKTSQEERICSICSQSFKKADHLARHFRSHTRERPFTCEACGKFYARQDTLLRHSRSCHVNAQISGRVSVDNGITTGVPAVVNEGRGQSLQTPAISGPEQMFPMSDQLLLKQQHLRPDDSGISAPNSSFTPSPEDLPTEEDRSIHERGDALMAQFATVDRSNTIPTHSSPWPVIWNRPEDLDWTSWLTGTDFDLDAVNQSLLEPAEIPAKDIAPNPDGGLELIQRRWHTFSESVMSSGQTTPDRHDTSNSGPYQIRTCADESYREELAERLQQRVQPGILPSTGFLDFCIQAYFTHFQSIFPLVHMPTFKPSKKNSILLLSICSVGSLFLGSSRAMAHGISMFERLQKAILASWDTHISATGNSSITSLQASLIGQTFGLLVGRPKDLTGIEIFHGSIVAWARQAKLFNISSDSETMDPGQNGEDLDARWRAWVRTEEKKRILAAIYIHDIELAKLHNHEPVLRHSIEKIPQLAALEVFAAPNAAGWKRQLVISQTPVPVPLSPTDTDCLSLSVENKPGNDFQSYAMLESIGSLTHEDRDLGGTRPTTVDNCQRLLVQWYHQRFNSSPQNSLRSSKIPDPFCLMILWHSTFMHLYTRFDDLECACGREGETVSQQKCAYAASWARSADAKRTLLHAVLIQRHFQSMAVGAEPAIHVPMALYYCGIAWASYTRFGTNELLLDSNSGDLDFPELRMLGINQTKLFYEVTRGIQLGRPESGPFFRVIDLLGKISHWKVSQNLSATLLAFVENLPDLF